MAGSVLFGVEDFLSLFPIETRYYFILWMVIWLVTILITPGPKAIETAYRLNFWHGLISTVLVVSILFGYRLPFNMTESFVTMCPTAYFVVDMIKNLLNDFYFKVPSYHSPSNRYMEYVHHVLTLSVFVYSELYHTTLCSFTSNPMINLLLAEASTPFLILWRQTNYKILGVVFTIIFFFVRIVYHCFVFIPSALVSCHWHIAVIFFGIMYASLQVIFTAQIIRKLIKGNRKDGENRDKSNKSH